MRGRRNSREEERITTRILKHEELSDWVHDKVPPGMDMLILIGDRLSCCDEAVGVEVSGEIVAVATIAPNGEQGSGKPTIVALYTLPLHRRKGFGREAFVAALARSHERGFAKVQVDILSRHVKRIIDGLSEKEKGYLDVHDFGPIMDWTGQLSGE